MVVLAAVVLHDYAGFGQRPELLPVEALVAQASMETLDEAILPRTAGLDIDRLDLVGGQPSLDFLGDKLGTIVTPQVGGRSVLGDGPPDPFEHIAALESTVGPQHMTLTGVFVQDRQHAQGSASRGGNRVDAVAPALPRCSGLLGNPVETQQLTEPVLAPGWADHSQPDGIRNRCTWLVSAPSQPSCRSGRRLLADGAHPYRPRDHRRLSALA